MEKLSFGAGQGGAGDADVNDGVEVEIAPITSHMQHACMHRAGRGRGAGTASKAAAMKR